MKMKLSSAAVLFFTILLPAVAISQGVDIPAALALATDGSHFVAGSGMDGAGRMDLLLLGFDPSGKFFGASRIPSQTAGSGFGRALLLPRDSVILVAGMVPNPSTGQYEMVTASFPRTALTSVSRDAGLPAEVTLSQSFPNPLRENARVATISYSIDQADQVRLTVANEEGETVNVLVEGWQQPGTHEARFDTGALPAGAYYYTLHVHGSAVTRKLLLLK